MALNPYINLEDKELMLKYQNGDHMAFDVLYSRHNDKVYSYLNKRLHSHDEIDDLFQKVFVKLHKSKSLYQDKYDVLPWIYTITRSEFLDHIKKKKLDTIEFNEESYATESLESENEFDIDAQKNLSEKEKNALKERYYEDKDFSVIAKLLDTSESNTRKIISRAIKKLRKKIEGEKNE